MKTHIFHFSKFRFLNFWRVLARKLMKKTPVFIIHFQNPIQIVHFYEVSRSASFFKKFHGRFNLMSIFFTFHRFYEKTYKKTYQFYGLFPNVLSLCAHSQSFVLGKFFLKKWRLFQYFNNLWFICSIWSNILRQSLWKDLPFFLHISKLPL